MNFLKSKQERLFEHQCRTLESLAKSGTLRYKESADLTESIINSLCQFHTENKWCGPNLAKVFSVAVESIAKSKEINFIQVVSIAHRLETEITKLLSND